MTHSLSVILAPCYIITHILRPYFVLWPPVEKKKAHKKYVLARMWRWFSITEGVILVDVIAGHPHHMEPFRFMILFQQTQQAIFRRNEVFI